MSSQAIRPPVLLLPLLLAALGGCQDPTSPLDGTDQTRPLFAQGDGGVWTVNTLSDAGDGVCDDTECTLREAIGAAASDDQIVFAGGLEGTLTLAGGQLVVTNKRVTIDGDGRITVDAGFQSRIFFVAADLFTGTPTRLALHGMTLTKGLAANGGAISAIIADVALEEVLMTGNLASGGSGGALSLSNADATIKNSTISGNSAHLDAGGILVGLASSLILTQSTVAQNGAEQQGGGIRNQGTLTVTGSTIMANTTTGDGGGIASSGVATIVKSTISGNTTSSYGGAIYSSGSLLHIQSSTLTANKGSVGGLYHLGTSHATVSNTVLAGNGGYDCVADFQSLGHNLFRSGAEGCLAGPASDVVVSPAQVFTQVLEEALSENGGPTLTHALIAGGRAVDAGYCPGETTDQRGFTRPVDDPAMPNALDGCDIGAYELQGPAVVIADLMVSQAVNQTSVRQGDLLTYLVRVQNLGPQAAPDVVMHQVLSSGVTFVSARSVSNKGAFTAPPAGETGTVTWYLGELLDQGNEVAEIEVTVLVKGRTTITSTASVTGAVSDPNPANNSAAITVSVDPGSGGNGGGGGNGNGNGQGKNPNKP